jgi:hypothetical protein
LNHTPSSMSVFFIHSSIHRHLGCFYNLAVVNNVVMNKEAQISLWELALSPLNTYPAVGLLDSREAPVLYFGRTSTLLSIAGVLFYSPTGFFCFFAGEQHGGLNSGPHACYVGVLPLKSWSQLYFLCFWWW